MNRSLLVFFFSYFLYFTTAAQSPPKREFRGAWIATYANIDWPNRTQNPAQQRSALITILNHHQATGINAVFLQVRSQSDALYQSTIEPWSADLTGTQGKAPAPLWDPLQFAIDECHKRGMELHAWINPYRAIANYSSIGTFAPTHVARLHPEWLIATGNLRTLDPGIPGVRDHVHNVITDIVQRYDVDGIHFDDYFYPNAAFNDDATYAADPRGITDRGDWRRDNVNLLIRRLNETIGSLKPWVKFGVSPSGIYRNSTNPDLGTPTSGLQHYITLYADSRKWLQEGWIDYLAPQVYWYIGQPGADYGKIVPWWNNNTYGRHMYIGLAGYKVNDPAQGVHWANPSQIPNEVRLNRSLSNIAGQAVYNTSSLRSTTKLGFRDSLRLDFYRKPALQPTMPWKDATPPGAPTDLKVVKYGADSVVLDWTSTATATSELDKVRQFVLYRSESPEVDISNAENILLIANSDSTRFRDRTANAGTTYYYVVTAVDRLHNESVSSNTAANLPPSVTCPGSQKLYLDASCSVAVPDYRPLVTVTAYSDVTLTQYPAPGAILNGASDYLVWITATDKGGNEGTCSFTITTLDTIAPVLSDITVNTPVLFPPNHKMREVELAYTATDNCTPVTNTVTVSSNEVVNSTGDGNTNPDWEVVNDHHVKLRAERSGTGEGRIYTIRVASTDAYGNTSTGTVTVSVPHNNRPVTVTRAAAAKEALAGSLSAKALPNPTTGRFTLLIQSASDTPLTIRVMDAAGRIVESRSGVAANGTLSFGSQYRPGVYYIEVKQGDALQTLKLVKL
ncbi:MAG TPA: family 10 glycosylhydrolase [Chitinophagaceae bacterium]